MHMRDFVYNQPAVRVRFGSGALEQLPFELERIGARRAIVLTTPGQVQYAERAARGLGSMAAATWSEAAVDVPMDTVRAAGAIAKRRDVDCYVAIGGGSTIGLAKAMALESDLPIVAVPTTYSGSEMTSIYGISDAGVKRTGRDIKAMPKAVLYDPSLTLTLPPKTAAPSGLSALAHCIEGLYAEHINPIITLLAVEGMRSIVRSLPIVVRDPANIDARSDVLYGAWLGGCVLGAVGMGVHHKLCQVLGTFNLPHAETHAVILPQAVAFNRDAAADAMRAVGEVLGTGNPAQRVYDFAEKLGAPLALKDIGMPADSLERAAALCTESPYYNPRPVEPGGVRRLLEDAWHGKRPS
jgi:alcohol dehydrogenase class IV